MFHLIHLKLDSVIVIASESSAKQSDLDMNSYCTYILSNKNDTVLYVGMTNNLMRIVWEHKSKLIAGFTKKYNVDKLVYFESFDNPEEAIKREKQ